MRLLLISDEESPYLWDYYQPGRLKEIDAILSCGDLKKEYLEFLVTMVGKPLYYVPGNHDRHFVEAPPEGCECLDEDLVNIGGVRVAGLGGCLRYRPGPYQYTEKEMEARVRRLEKKIRKAGGLDILIAHAPPRGYGDAPDGAHRGFAAFLPLMEKYRPRYVIHGHLHPSYGYGLPREIPCGETTVMNAVGWRILEIEPCVPPAPEKKRRFPFRFIRH